ncbi:hypothetical protein [Thaumasiovibrio sp. DFM-14]|uniref:hypothetical protein n=1 Tax=Thaumasiovibrio sp. DFM-14 TaxID=3384792 RepID=UPI0039A16E75
MSNKTSRVSKPVMIFGTVLLGWVFSLIVALGTQKFLVNSLEMPTVAANVGGIFVGLMLAKLPLSLANQMAKKEILGESDQA